MDRSSPASTFSGTETPYLSSARAILAGFACAVASDILVETYFELFAMMMNLYFYQFALAYCDDICSIHCSYHLPSLSCY